MTEFYVAFSKHGSNCFITANKEFKRDANGTRFMLDGYDFTRANSRTSSLRSATKLHTSEISNNSTPQEVLTFFDKLRANGWNVDDAAYIKRNNLTPNPIVNVPVEQVIPSPDNSIDENTVAQNNAETTTQIVVENGLTNSVAEVASVALAKQIEQRMPEVEKAFESTAEIAKQAEIKPKGLQPLGEMQKKFISILGTESPDNIWTIQNEVTIAQMQHLLGSKYNLIMGPSDIKRVLVGLVKRNLIKFDGEKVTKV